MAEKIYPDKTLEDHWQKMGWSYTVAWEISGPKHTGVAWMVGYALNGAMVIVQTYKDGGWDAYTADRSNRIDAAIADVTARCGLANAA